MVDKNIIQSRFTKLGVVPIDNQHYLYATLDNNLIGIIMHGQRIDLRVREAVAAALLDIVQNKGDAVVEVFMLFGTGGREKRIRACTLLQIFPDRIPEMFARFCHNGVGFG